jgi:hypothetical protein
METKIYYLHKGDNIPFYIGKTINSLIKRQNEHSIKFKTYCEIELLDTVKLNEWKFWEKYYISLFKSWGFKLENKNNGGSGPSFYNEEERKKFKTPKSIVINYVKAKSKPVYQYTLQGILIKKWDSAIEAAKSFGKYTGSDINKSCKIKNKVAYGFIWKRFNDEPLPKINIDQFSFKKTTKLILQYDLKDNFIKEWQSQICALESLGLSYNNVSLNQCLKGKQKTAYGFKWKYKI